MTGLQPFQVGQLVEWRYVQRGGYGFWHWVPAVVVKDHGARVTIDAERADGTYRRRRVSASSLRDAEFRT